MKRYISVQISEYKRTLENRRLRLRLYTFLLFITFIFYGYFGLYRYYETLQQKKETIQTLEEMYSSALVKKGILTNFAYDINESEYAINSLKDSIPDVVNVEEFLVEVVRAAAKAGYRQRTFYVNARSDNSAVINISLQGVPSLLDSLLVELENMKRLNEVDSLTVSYKEGTAAVNLRLIIYYY